MCFSPQIGSSIPFSEANLPEDGASQMPREALGVRGAVGPVGPTGVVETSRRKIRPARGPSEVSWVEWAVFWGETYR